MEKTMWDMRKRKVDGRGRFEKVKTSKPSESIALSPLTLSCSV